MGRTIALIPLLIGLCLGTSSAQEDGGPIQGRTATSLRRGKAERAVPAARWKTNRLISSALARSVLVTPRPMPGGDGGNSAVPGLLRKQGAAARTLLSSGAVARPLTSAAGTTQPEMLMKGGTKPQATGNPAVPLMGPGQAMSASGSQTSLSSPSDTTMAGQSGPTRHQAPDSPKPQMIGSRAPSPKQLCMGGIASVDGQKSGIWFSPVSGPDGMFVIRGCGFGDAPGEVYLSGLHYGSASPADSARRAMAPLFRDQVSFQIVPDGWSDRQIVAQIDANASGFYDTTNVTLVVKTGTGQQYQAAGMNFQAAREDQMLKLLPKPSVCAQATDYSCVPLGVSLATVNAVVSGPVHPEVESPSEALLQPGETVAVARETAVDQFPIPANPGRSFPGGTDTYQFHFAPGFQLDPHNGVQLRHASPDTGYCQTVGGVPSKSGNWNVNYTSTASFQVSWEADDCWPNSTMNSGKSLDVLNYASVSAYSLEITVLGPRGVSPWPSGNVRSLEIAPQPLPALLKQ
jgi:hypothetical protein